MATPDAQVFGQGVLGQGDAGHPGIAGPIAVREQNDQRGAGAHQQRVDKYTERLHDALTDRVRHKGERGDVGRAAKARFVAEQPAFYPLHNRRADAAAQRRVETESAAQDVEQHRGDLGGVQADNQHRRRQVSEGHKRHQDLGHGGNAPNPAEEYETQHSHQHSATEPGRHAEGIFKGGRHHVGLHRIEAEAEGHQQQHRIHDGQAVLFDAPRQAVGRPAAVAAIGLAAFVQLGEGTLEEAGGHTHQADDPHPEHGARATQRNGHGNAGDIAATDPPGHADRQRLKRTDMALVAPRGRAQHGEHAPEITKLNAAGSQREVQPDADEQRDKHFAPQKITERRQHALCPIR